MLKNTTGVRIAFIHPTVPFSEGTGATHSATEIVTGLVDRGHEVTVYCDNDAPDGGRTLPFETRLLEYDETFPNDSGTEVNAAIRARKAEFAEFDLVHSYLMKTIPAMLSLSGVDVRTVVTLNAYGGVCPKNDLQYMDRSTCDKYGAVRCGICTLNQGMTTPKYDEHRLPGRFARILYNPVKNLRRLRHIKQSNRKIELIDRFQALSKHIRRTYSDFGYPRGRINVVPNILDERFAVDHETDFQAPFRLLYVGYLKKHKGVERLVPTLARLRADYDARVSLTVAGDGPSRTEMERQARNLGVTEHVEFRGHVPYDTLPSVYRTHDVFVYPGTWEEPFGRVFLESLAVGTPVLGTDVGAVSEIIGDAGRVVENETGAIVSGLAEFLDTKTLTECSRRAMERVRRYKKNNVMDQVEKMYEQTK